MNEITQLLHIDRCCCKRCGRIFRRRTFHKRRHAPRLPRHSWI